LAFASAIRFLVDEVEDADDEMFDDDGGAEAAAAPRSIPCELDNVLSVEPESGDVDICMSDPRHAVRRVSAQHSTSHLGDEID
jgi:hypothetical protein